MDKFVTIEELLKQVADIPSDYQICFCVHKNPNPLDQYDTKTRDAFIGICQTYNVNNFRMGIPMSYVKDIPFSPWQLELDYLPIDLLIGNLPAISFYRYLPESMKDWLDLNGASHAL